MNCYTRLLLSTGLAVMIACTGDQGRDEQTGEMNRGPEYTEETGQPGGTEAMPENVMMGKAIFEGKAAGGICYTCHSPDATGTQTGPDLTDARWLNIDEPTKDNIKEVVQEGVQKPKEHQAPMPAFKNTLNDEQIDAVAEYVYWLSQHGTTGQMPSR